MSSSPRLLPFSFDALLPAPERYASYRFRLVAQSFAFKRLDWHDSVELVAFVETIGLKWARYILHWKGRAVIKAYRRLRLHVGDHADLAYAMRENENALGPDVGVAVFRAMVDGGWKGGRKLPPVVRHALMDLRKAGVSQVKLGKMLGLSVDQVRTATGERRKPDKSAQMAAVVGLTL